MTQDEIRDLAILVTEHLLDNASHLLSTSTLEVRDEFDALTWTPDTFELQDTITEAITKNLPKR